MIVVVLTTPSWSTTKEIHLYQICKLNPTLIMLLTRDDRKVFPQLGLLINLTYISVYNSFGIQLLQNVIPDTNIPIKYTYPTEPILTSSSSSNNSLNSTTNTTPQIVYSINTNKNTNKIDSSGICTLFESDQKEILAFLGVSNNVTHRQTIDNALSKIPEDSFKSLFGLQPNVFKNLLLFRFTEFSPLIKDVNSTTTTTIWHPEFLNKDHYLRKEPNPIRSVFQLCIIVKKLYKIFKYIFKKVHSDNSDDQQFLFDKTFLNWIAMLESEETLSLQNMNAEFVVRKFAGCLCKFGAVVVSKQLHSLSFENASNYLFEKSKFVDMQQLFNESTLIASKQNAYKRRDPPSTISRPWKKSNYFQNSHLHEYPNHLHTTLPVARTNFPPVLSTPSSSSNTSSNYCISNLAHLLLEKQPCKNSTNCKFFHLTKKNTYSTAEKQNIKSSIEAIKTVSFRNSMEIAFQGLN